MEEWDPIIGHSADTLKRETSINSDTIDEFLNYENELKATNCERFKKIVQKTPPGTLALFAILDFARPENCSNRFKEVIFIHLLKCF